MKCTMGQTFQNLKKYLKIGECRRLLGTVLARYVTLQLAPPLPPINKTRLLLALNCLVYDEVIKFENIIASTVNVMISIIMVYWKL